MSRRVFILSVLLTGCRCLVSRLHLDVTPRGTAPRHCIPPNGGQRMPGKSYLFYKFFQPFYLQPHPRDSRLSINSPLLGALIFTTVKRNKMKYTYQLYLDQTYEPASSFGFTGHFSGHWDSSQDFFFSLKIFIVWGLRLLALYRRSPAVMPVEGIRSVPRDSCHTGSSHSSKAGDRQGHGGKG